MNFKEVSSKVFVNNFYECTKNENRRYCFILGSGASCESKIHTGQELAKVWKSEIDEMYSPKEINDIKAALTIESDLDPEDNTNYFDIYDVRFYPEYINGYAFLEKELSNKEPSFGYYHLAKILSETKNNLVLTTNFDSLCEDAIFIYTDIVPLVINHESLARYIHANIQRPIIAKIHRGVFFDPLNRRNETNTLSKTWHNTFDMIFNIFTPVVIGYAGGDKSLMKYLEKTKKLKSIYWCYRGEEPNEDIQKIVKKANGYFVNLEELRKQHNLSQTQIADALNITQQAYSNYENGKREADYGTLANLAIYFNTTIDYILGISNDPAPSNKKDPPPFTEEDALRILAEVKNLSDDEVAHLKSTLKIFDKTHEARQISERISEKLNEETSDELAPESN